MQFIKDILNNDLETTKILKKLNSASRGLAKLSGVVQSLPNQQILIDTLSLQEAKDSSEIENIITTQDDIFKQKLQTTKITVATKEVENYANALIYLYECALNNQNIITINNIIKSQTIIKQNDAGLRTQVGTALKNEQTGQIIYTPPPPEKLFDLLADLEKFINDDDTNLDPLIKMAIIHHQFESIHPFYDGNGRIGRIINIVYLAKNNLLDYPILYLSRYINNNKNKYYELLQSVRDDNNWEEWIIFMLDAIEKTSIHGINLIQQIKQLQQEYKTYIREYLPKIYSQDLINNIFKHPYTKIAFIINDLQVSRITATNYLNQLVDKNILIKQKLGKENYYINSKLVNILFDTPDMKEKI
jgi:Fic family protein